MNIIPQEITLIELCRLLNITPSWVNKTIGELSLSKSGRGKIRVFSREEYYVFRNIKIMLICNISWSFIKKLRQKEKHLKDKISDLIKKLEEEEKQGKVSLHRLSNQHYSCMKFLLAEDLIIPYSVIDNIRDDSQTPITIRSLIDEATINEEELFLVKQKLIEEINKIKIDLDDLLNSPPYGAITNE